MYNKSIILFVILCLFSCSKEEFNNKLQLTFKQGNYINVQDANIQVQERALDKYCPLDLCVFNYNSTFDPLTANKTIINSENISEISFGMGLIRKETGGEYNYVVTQPSFSYNKLRAYALVKRQKEVTASVSSEIKVNSSKDLIYTFKDEPISTTTPNEFKGDTQLYVGCIPELEKPFNTSCAVTLQPLMAAFDINFIHSEMQPGNYRIFIKLENIITHANIDIINKRI